jgi:hypothetical protein
MTYLVHDHDFDTPQVRRATVFLGVCLVYWRTVARYIFLATFLACHRFMFLLNFVISVALILFATHSMVAKIYLRFVVANFSINQTGLCLNSHEHQRLRSVWFICSIYLALMELCKAKWIVCLVGCVHLRVNTGWQDMLQLSFFSRD